MSTNEKEVREFFLENRPHVGSGTEFTDKLVKQMDSLAEIKRLQLCAERQYRWTIVTVLVIGLIVGGLSTAFILLRPVSAPVFKIELLNSLIAFCSEWKILIFVILALTAIFLSLRKTSSQSL